MKVLYATDLHGQSDKFKAVLKVIDDHEILILGADILPKGEGASERKIMDFIIYKLPEFFMKIKIPVFIDFGNDDWYMYYKMFKNVVDVYDHVHISHMNEIKIGDYTFIGMQYVPDYPFGIKDWCREDSPKVCDSNQMSLPYESYSGVIKKIPDLYTYFHNQDSIFVELNKLSLPTDKTVYIIHAPPIQSGLDVCFRVGPVGSNDVRLWIETNKPFLTLHGHIHESYEITNTALTKINDTICINPGQKGGYGYSNFVWCEFDLSDVEGTFIRKEIKE